MSHQALYRKYRPHTFEDVVEQQHVVTTLKNTVVSNKMAHAYLFCGTRGTGKTTMAKIFARAVNCLKPVEGNPCNQCEICQGILNGSLLDVVEIDAASNNSVDNVRDIINEVIYAPTSAAYKVYIVDEVHMLSTGAFNALLKTLEEPPEHVLFILATTEPHKLPATVLSRCQRYDFKRISTAGIMERLLLIAKEADVAVTQEAARFIASLAEGALRDGISLLDQCMTTGKDPLDLDSVHEIIGMASGSLIIRAASYLIEKKGKDSIDTVDQLFSDGKDPGQFLQRLIQLFRDMMVYKTTSSLDQLLSMTEEECQAIPAFAGQISTVDVLAIVRALSDVEGKIKWSSSPRILLEMAFMRICSRELDKEEDSWIDRVRLLEEKIRRLEEGLRYNGSPSIGYSQTNPGDRRVLSGEQIKKTVSGNKTKKTGENSESPEKQTVDKKAKGVSQKSFSEWAHVLEDLKSMGRMKLYSSLVDSTAIWIDEQTIGIILEQEDLFQKMVLNKNENIVVISDAIKRCKGQPLKVKMIHSETNESKPDSGEIPDTVLSFAKKNGLKIDIVEE